MAQLPRSPARFDSFYADVFSQLRNDSFSGAGFAYPMTLSARVSRHVEFAPPPHRGTLIARRIQSTALKGRLAMFRDNVIWVDFRISKDIRDKQALSFAERLNASSERTRRHLAASRVALDAIMLTLGGRPSGSKPNDES